MHQGLYFGLNNKCIEKYTKNAQELSLLAKGEGTEIMFQKIKPGERMFISPGETNELMEFVYILDGEIVYEKDDTEIMVKRGEYFYVHNLKETVQFKAINEVTLLYVSTQPVFHYLSKRIRELREIAKKSQEKDQYTHNHVERVKDFAVKIGNKLRLSNGKIEHIAFASLFHDIGKVNVPDGILQKPRSLTDEEMDYIRKHPLDGAEMVKNTYFQNLGKIIAQHHERLDGSGYPYNLMGYEICIEAKIIAVADVFDAMTTDRPYKKGISPSEALAELKLLSGIHYDEKVVKAFKEVLREEGIIKD